jgi:hypothetical protein
MPLPPAPALAGRAEDLSLILTEAGSQREDGEPGRLEEVRSRHPGLRVADIERERQGGDFFNHNLVLVVALACWLGEEIGDAKPRVRWV